MAVKSIIEIDVSDAAFRRFKTLYDKYEEQLKKAPQMWGQVGKKVENVRDLFEGLVSQNQLLAEAQREASRRSGEFAENMRRATRDSGTFLSNLRAGVSSLARIGLFTGAGAGLLGIGGLFGLQSLAGGASSARRSAMGLGVSPGQQSAFGLNFGRFVDTGSLLSNVNTALRDFTSPQYLGLASAGLGGTRGNPAEVSLALLRRLPQLFAGVAPGMIGPLIRARRLDQLLPAEDIQRYLAASPEERLAQERHFGADQGRLGANADTLRAWQDLTTQLDRADRSIYWTLVRGLSNLAGPIEKVSVGFEHAVEAFLKAPAVQHWLDVIAQGLEKFGNYVGTPEFEENVEKFVTAIGKLANVIENVVNFFVAPRERFSQEFLDRLRAKQSGGGRAPGAISASPYGPSIGTSPLAPIGKLTPENLLPLISYLEGSGDSAVSAAGAIGKYQIMPQTGAGVGFSRSDLFDPAKNRMAASKVLADLIKTYHGNLAEILVGYNASTETRNRFTASGDDPRVLPLETQRYLSRAGLLDMRTMKLTVHNVTGGNAVVSATQAAGGN